MTFSDKDMELLSKSVEERLSPTRYLHTLGVAKAAVKLAELCLPERVRDVEAAALLHDISKEYPIEMQYALIKEFDINVDAEDIESPAVLHSFTAPAVIRRDFPAFSTPEILTAVYNHTIGAADMTVFDEIIFLADYIEENRKYDSCISVRNYVFDNMKFGDPDSNIIILHKGCIKAINYTLENLKSKNKPINRKNILTRNALLSKI